MKGDTMKRTAGAFVLLAAVGGCLTPEKTGTFGGGNSSVEGCPSGACALQQRTMVANAIGPWGQPVETAYADAGKQMSGAEWAKYTIATGVTPDMIQRVQYSPEGPPPNVAGLPAPGSIAPPGVMTLPPGMPHQPGAGQGAPPPGHAPFVAQRTEIRFLSPAGMQVAWYAPSPTSKNGFTSQTLGVPGRYHFVQGAIYRLKINGIPGNVNDYYPTLEVVPTNAKTAAFLAHSSVPISFTQEDFEQVDAGNFLVKVIYLPDPQFQDQVAVGPNELVSTRLEPGVDAIAEACRRGSILAVVRFGNINLEAAGTPPMDAPPPYIPHPAGPASRGGLLSPGHGFLPPIAPGSPNALPNTLTAPPSDPSVPSGDAPADPSTSSKAPTKGAMTPASLAGQKKKAVWADLPPNAN
jgi:hypothetical protein